MQEHYDEFFEEVFTELEDKVCTQCIALESSDISSCCFFRRSGDSECLYLVAL